MVLPYLDSHFLAYRSLRFSKRFFWFSDDALKTDTLDSYLRTEKADIAHPNAAWAHETGKGLLFFAKRAEDRAAPSGILNLVGSFRAPFPQGLSLNMLGRPRSPT
jgi:Pleckstrin homology domain